MRRITRKHCPTNATQEEIEDKVSALNDDVVTNTTAFDGGGGGQIGFYKLMLHPGLTPRAPDAG